MKSFRLGAVTLIAVSAAVAGGCASQEQAQQAADARNPCLGVAPATGTIVRRNSDCGGPQAKGDSAADAAARQQMVDEIRNTPSLGRSPVSPGAGR